MRHVKAWFIHVCAVISLVFVRQSSAQEQWILEAGGSLPYNIPMPLVVRQVGYQDIRLTGHYDSEPLIIPICWVWRVGCWHEGRSWELEGIHQKLYLTNLPQEVAAFSVTHGFNLVTICRGWELAGYIVRLGAGIVVAHPENTVRGRVLPESEGVFNSGYYIGGPTVGIGCARHVHLTEGLFVACEGSLHASYACVPVRDGNADVYNIALMFTLGVGYGFGDRP